MCAFFSRLVDNIDFSLRTNFQFKNNDFINFCIRAAHCQFNQFGAHVFFSIVSAIQSEMRCKWNSCGINISSHELKVSIFVWAAYFIDREIDRNFNVHFELKRV